MTDRPSDRIWRLVETYRAFFRPPVEDLLGAGDPVVDQSLAVAHWPTHADLAEIDLLESWYRMRSR